MEKRYLWFTATTIPNYEQKIAKDLKTIKIDRNIEEIQEIIIPMEEYTTPKGIIKERPKVPNYFYIKIEVDNDNQPPTAIWHLIRNLKGCIGLLQRDKYMIGMDDFELKEELGITDEDIKVMAEKL